MREELVKIGNCELLVERFGERLGSGPPLVVLHGEEGPSPALPFLEALAGDFEVHAPRHPGWSGSSRPNHIATVRDIALVQQEYLERLEEQPVVLVGLSFGGWVAAELAANAPRLVGTLVLISPLGIKVGGREDRDFVDIYMSDPSERALTYRRPPFFEGPADLEREAWLREKAIADEALARYCWKPYMHDPTLRGRLRRIRASTLIVSGRHDAFVLNPAYYETYAQAIPGARHVPVDGGHRLEEEQPQAMADLVNNAAKSR